MLACSGRTLLRAEALEKHDSYDVASEFRLSASMNRAVAEYYEAFPYSQGAYSGKEGENGDAAYQVYSSHFLSWLAEKAREEERKELKKRKGNQPSEPRNNDEPYEEPDE